MPHQARLNRPGTLHHAIARGLERGAYFCKACTMALPKCSAYRPPAAVTSFSSTSGGWLVKRPSLAALAHQSAWGPPEADWHRRFAPCPGLGSGVERETASRRKPSSPENASRASASCGANLLPHEARVTDHEAHDGDGHQ